MNIPTIEELDKIASEAAGLATGISGKYYLYVTAIRDAVVAACRPQLRPIAEMPKEVPEGCVRVYWKSKTKPSTLRKTDDTHYIDIALPADAYPPEFEAAWEQIGKLEPKSAAFALWKGGAQ